MTHIKRYEQVRISSKTSLEEFLFNPIAWFNLILVSLFAPRTLFRSVKYGGGIGLPSALFLVLSTYYTTAILHAGGWMIERSIWGGFYLSLMALGLWVLCSGYLHLLRKSMAVHPRFKHFMRFAVWNQLIWLLPFSLIYLASFFWSYGSVLLNFSVLLALGYSIFGFIYVFQPRAVLAPLATVICAISLFASLSVVVGLRGPSGEHNQLTAWMDPKVAVPRLEYHYYNEKRTMIAMYEKWKNPNSVNTPKRRLAQK